MVRKTNPPFPSGGDWQQWARQLLAYLADRGEVDTENAPRPVLLSHQVGDPLTYRAFTNGVLMYDPTTGPVVSYAGGWDAIITASAPVFPTFYASTVLPAPILVTEAGGDTELTRLTVAVPEAGTYRIELGLVSEYLQANDRLLWWATGALASPVFMKEAKEVGETIAFSYALTFPVSGPFELILWGSTDGPGAADVSVIAADLYMSRIV